MSALDLRDLYQDVILDHGRSPRNFRRIDQPTHRAHGHNPMCGDTLLVFLRLGADGTIEDVSFEGQGCAISMASASLMTEVLRGKTPDEAERVFDAFHKLCTGDLDDLDSVAGMEEDDAERLAVLAGVRDYPVRVKCATLAWHTLHAALAGEDEVSSE